MILFCSAAAVFLYIIPGWALLCILFHKTQFSFFEKLGISAGLSVALYPLLMLWFRIARLPVGFWACLAPGALGFLVIIWKHRNKLKRSFDRSEDLDVTDSRSLLLSAIVLITIGLIFITRFSAIREMIAPSWGDSVHHTMIVQLILENGGLFDSWLPYAPLESMIYHFGFHAAASAFAFLTGFGASQSVLVVGQILNGLAVLVLFSLVSRLSGSRWAGLAALIFAGLIFPHPGFFVNWGRYTQLTAQVILPVLILLFVLLMSGREKPEPGIYVTAAILAAGTVLCHYRVSLLAVAGAASWGIWGIWQMRKKLLDWAARTFWLGCSAAAAFLLILPWLLKIRRSRVYSLFADAQAFRTVYDIDLWKNTSFYFSGLFLILGGVAVILAFIYRPRLAIPATGWCFLSFFMTNAFLFGLHGVTWLNNAVLLFALYIPLGIFFGWASGFVLEKAVKRRAGVLVASFLVLFLLGWGSVRQRRIVDPFFQMMTTSDKEVFDWIETEVPEDAVFFVNGFRVPDTRLVVGSDAGWWLPFYTRRSSRVLPALYRAEKAGPSLDIESVTQLIDEVLASGGEPGSFLSALCRHGITHVFLGQKRGTVGYGARELIPESWLSQNPGITLLYQRDKAQVWRVSCPDSSPGPQGFDR